jgi:hypothetical protein
MMRSACISAVLVLASTAVSTRQQLPSEPMRQFGSSVTAAFEGWYQNPDGSYTFLVGYLNRNFAQAVDVPIGQNNRIEPGGPDIGQPTHFLPGRQYGMFTVRVPKDFTAQQRLTWFITVNGVTTTIPLRLNPDYVVQPFADVAVKNTPPVVRLDEQGPTIQGPIATIATAKSYSARAGTPLAIALWAEDDEKFSSGNNAPQRNPPPPVVLTWSKYRGPGPVKFDKESPPFEKLAGRAAFSGKSTVSATFSEPGEYLLHVTANDFSGEGGGGEVCCWTTALVKVNVTP